MEAISNLGSVQIIVKRAVWVTKTYTLPRFRSVFPGFPRSLETDRRAGTARNTVAARGHPAAAREGGSGAQSAGGFREGAKRSMNRVER
jgi:hypothetical protein